MHIKGRYSVDIKYRYYLDADSNEDAKRKILEIIDTKHLEEINSHYTPVVGEEEEQKWKKKRLNWKT
tara:strand:- start:164 stop:364 length:201 start_codon:yes stop_codon:yes gene_type:complete